LKFDKWWNENYNVRSIIKIENASGLGNSSNSVYVKCLVIAEGKSGEVWQTGGLHEIRDKADNGYHLSIWIKKKDEKLLSILKQIFSEYGLHGITSMSENQLHGIFPEKYPDLGKVSDFLARLEVSIENGTASKTSTESIDFTEPYPYASYSKSKKQSPAPYRKKKTGTAIGIGIGITITLIAILFVFGTVPFYPQDGFDMIDDDEVQENEPVSTSKTSLFTLLDSSDFETISNCIMISDAKNTVLVDCEEKGAANFETPNPITTMIANQVEIKQKQGKYSLSFAKPSGEVAIFELKKIQDEVFP